jgi:hypothetical protein
VVALEDGAQSVSGWTTSSFSDPNWFLTMTVRGLGCGVTLIGKQTRCARGLTSAEPFFRAGVHRRFGWPTTALLFPNWSTSVTFRTLNVLKVAG